MARAIILVMDSFGIGAAPDAESFGDVGADTLGHIAATCATGATSGDRPASGPLTLPNLECLGLADAALIGSGSVPVGLSLAGDRLNGSFGAAAETSRGKDTPSGHWEMAGLPVDFDWGFFPRTVPAFPDEVVSKLTERAGLPGILGNCHASGTTIIAELGLEHIQTGKPICYTSADSVFQIAAHEEHFGLERLYQLCLLAEKILKPWNIGRVIARPFVGSGPDDFKRTANRRDYTTPPHGETLLDRVKNAGGDVYSVGKIADIFANQGVTVFRKAAGNMALFDATLQALDESKDGDLIFTNFVDFDMEYGHRRNPLGYAAALEAFDKRLPELQSQLKADDMVVITADHGCDPTWPGSDHTRENVPVLIFGGDTPKQNLGQRESFADMGQTLCHHLGLPALPAGKNCF